MHLNSIGGTSSRHSKRARRAAMAALALAAAAGFGYSGSASAADLTWDPLLAQSTSPTPTASDGLGNWDPFTANWSNGVSDVAWIDGSNAIIGFGGDAASINVGTVAVDGLTFNSSYSIGGGTISFTGTNGIVANQQATIGSYITGANALILKSGTLMLAGTADYTGNTEIQGGQLLAGYTNITGSATSTLLMSGGTFDIGGFGQNVKGMTGTSGTITSSTGVAVLATNVAAGTTSSFGGTLAVGAGMSINKTGAGTQIITSAGNTIDRLGLGAGTLILEGADADHLATLTVAKSIDDYSAVPIFNTGTLVIKNATLTVPGVNQQGDVQKTNLILIQGAGTFEATVSKSNYARNQGNICIQLSDDGYYNGGTQTLTMASSGKCSAFFGLKDRSRATFGNIYIASNNTQANTSYSTLEVDTSRGLDATNLYVGDKTSNAASVLITQVNHVSGNVTLSGTTGLRLANTRATGSTLEATYNLKGGILATPRVLGGAGTATLNFHGGTLALNGTTSQADFINLGANGNAYIYEGATIDTGALDATITQALKTPNGASHVESITVTNGSGFGAGIMVPPLVRFTGDGTGATGIARLDSAGQVTGIDITNPGVGYTTPPTVELVYKGVVLAGGTIEATIANSNYNGGLTKIGSGTLTLGGANTYTGTTAVNAGVLKLNSALAGPLAASGTGTAELNVDLGAGVPVTVGAGGTVVANLTQTVKSVSVDPAGKFLLNGQDINLNVTDGGLVSPATLTSVWTAVRAGYNGGSGPWTGTGITTTAVTNSSLNGLGLVLAGDSLVGPQTLTVREMILGDVNGDNKVTIGDVMVALNSANYQQDGTWLNGDVNYDGKVTIGDVMLMLNSTRYQQDYNPANAPAQIAALEAAGLGSLASAAVPEPATLGLLAVGAMGFLARRRRA